MKLLSIKEAAAMVGCSRSTLRRWCRDGDIPRPAQVGKSLRFDAEALDAWLKAQFAKRREADNAGERQAAA